MPNRSLLTRAAPTLLVATLVAGACGGNSTTAGIVTVTQAGLVHAVAQGSAIVTAGAGPHIATSKITVVGAQ